MNNPILLLSDHEPDAVFAKALAAKMQLSLIDRTGSAQALLQLSEKGPFPILLLNGDAPELCQEFRQLLSQLPSGQAAAVRENTFVLVESANALCQKGLLTEVPPAAHFLCRNSWTAQTAQDAALACSDLISATLGPGGLGLKGLMPRHAEFHSLTFQESMQKGFGAEAITHLLKELDLSDRMASVISNCADELLMNAIFDAPLDESGLQKLRKMPRTQNFPLHGKTAVELHLAVDDQTIGINVVDHMGTLNRESILRHVCRSHGSQTTPPENPLNRVENAGMGLAFIFRTGASLLFACEPGRRTEATVLFKRARTVKDSRGICQLLSTRFYRSAESLC